MLDHLSKNIISLLQFKTFFQFYSNYNRFIAALLVEARNDKQPKCSEPLVKEIDRLVEGFATDVLSLICPLEYQGKVGDKCESIIQLTPQITSTKLRTKSMLMPIVNIFNSLKN